MSGEPVNIAYAPLHLLSKTTLFRTGASVATMSAKVLFRVMYFGTPGMKGARCCAGGAPAEAAAEQQRCRACRRAPVAGAPAGCRLQGPGGG